jgi:hypothetical protein
VLRSLDFQPRDLKAQRARLIGSPRRFPTDVLDEMKLVKVINSAQTPSGRASRVEYRSNFKALLDDH